MYNVGTGLYSLVCPCDMTLTHLSLFQILHNVLVAEKGWLIFTNTQTAKRHGLNSGHISSQFSWITYNKMHDVVPYVN